MMEELVGQNQQFGKILRLFFVLTVSYNEAYSTISLSSGGLSAHSIKIEKHIFS